MASNYTSSYQLCQWEASDKVLRTDFNGDNAKIDAALAAHDGELDALTAALAGKADSSALTALAEGQLRIITGSYTGTGVSAVIHYDTVRRPKMLIATCNNYYNALEPTLRAIIAIDGIEIRIMSSHDFSTSFNDMVSFDDDGFTLDHTLMNIDLGMNRQGYQVDYWILC